MTDRSFTHALLDTSACRRMLSSIGHSARGEKILRQLGRHHGVFDSFKDAWAAAAEDRHAGHDHPDSVRYSIELASSLRPSDYAALYWLLRLSPSSSILDYGGSVGNLFYNYCPFLSDHASLTWIVNDLPSVIAEGRRLAVERGVAHQLSFTETLQDAPETEILLASGAIHYWEHEIEEFFAQLRGRPEHVIVNRTPLHESARAFITIQRNENYAVPCIVRNAGEFIASFERLGYVLVNRWRALELAINMPLFPEKAVPWYSGFYFRLERRSRAVG